MRASLRHAFAVFAIALLAPAKNAHADVALDGLVEAGIAQRFVRDTRVPGTNLGPVLWLHGAIALLPFVRVGAYGHFELDTRTTFANRQVYAGGAFFRVDSPLRTPRWVPWLRVGVGYAATHDPTERLLLPLTGQDDTWRGHLEIPLAIGVSYKFWKPFFMTFGSGVTLALPGLAGSANPDRLALHLALGLGFEH